MFVRTFIEQPDNKFFLSAARGAKPRSAGYPTPQKKLIKPRTDSMRIRSQKDSRRIAEGWQKNSRRTSLMIYPFNIPLLSEYHPFAIRLWSLEGKFFKEEFDKSYRWFMSWFVVSWWIKTFCPHANRLLYPFTVPSSCYPFAIRYESKRFSCFTFFSCYFLTKNGKSAETTPKKAKSFRKKREESLKFCSPSFLTLAKSIQFSYFLVKI